jgi:hypothetical protein
MSTQTVETEMVEEQQEVEQVEMTESEEEQESTSPELQEEEFAKERAMDTIKKLRANEKRAAKKLAALEKAEEERKRAEMSEMDRLKADLETSQSALRNLELLEMKRAAAAKFELPPKLAARLTGETPEEIEKDAEELAATLPKAKKLPKISTMNPGEQGAEEITDEERRDWLFRS